MPEALSLIGPPRDSCVCADPCADPPIDAMNGSDLVLEDQAVSCRDSAIAHGGSNREPDLDATQHGDRPQDCSLSSGVLATRFRRAPACEQVQMFNDS